MFKVFSEIANRDNSGQIGEALRNLINKEVLVGVPQDQSSRTGEITNAELAYIHTHGIRTHSMIQEMDEPMDRGVPYSRAYEMYLQAHGSPLWASPPRPIIEPAIEANKEQISELLKTAAQMALDGDIEGCNRELNRAGLMGQNVARGWFTNPSNDWAPNAESTVKGKGSDQPLIDTGELRKAITYVIRER